MKTKLQSALLLISTLFVGIIMGFLINGQLVKYRFEQQRNFFKNGEDRVEKILGELELDSEKKESIKPVIEHHFKQMHAISQAHRKEFRGQMDQFKSELSQYLNDSEMDQFRKKMRMFRRHRGHKPPRK